MRVNLRGVSAAIAVLIVLGVAGGLFAASLRYRVESRNRRVEIGVDWPEVSLLAQMSQMPVSEVLKEIKAQDVSTLIITEDTLGALEQAGAAHAARVTAPDGRFGTRVMVDSNVTFQRIHDSLRSHGIAIHTAKPNEIFPPQGGTLFILPASSATGQAAAQEYASVGYTNLRPIGMGLPPEACAAARDAPMRIAGRISNFPGVRLSSAESVLRDLKHQGADVVIFNGDDALGYRGLEKDVADFLRDPKSAQEPEKSVGLMFGEVEFGKQKGDEKIAAALHGDYLRVHNIQGAEMGPLEEDDAIERYVRAARERNIRFCYVRLWTQAGSDPVGENVEYLKKISLGLQQGSEWTGGGLDFGAARQFEDTVSPEHQKYLKLLFAVMALGVAAGTLWLLRTLAPLSDRVSWLLLAGLCIVCVGSAFVLGETGRKLVALLAGIVFPTLACLLAFPRPRSNQDETEPFALPLRFCLSRAVRSLAFASGITSLGIVLVVGLLATRPFMVRANQFLGIKAQHAVPLMLIALVALTGGFTLHERGWQQFHTRLFHRIREMLREPARFGLLIGGGVGLFVLMVIVSRTGNDSSVGASGGEMKIRAILDTILVVRPRTKEFLIGHPAFVLALAWWWRGRRKPALIAFVVGSIGQVSLLNTFCHIHTPLIISLWRDGLGLLIGTLLGAGLFLIIERVIPKSRVESSILPEESFVSGNLHPVAESPAVAPTPYQTGL